MRMQPANQDEAKGTAYWLLRQEEGGLTAVEQAEYEAWLAADPERPAAMAAMQSTLEDTALMAAMARFAPREAPTRPGLDRRALIGGGIAAGLALALGVPVLLERVRHDAAPEALVTPSGAQQRLTLADGSQMVLNGGTRLLTTLDEPTRRATLLSGEAFLQVAAAEGNRFQIDCPSLHVESAIGAINLDVLSDLTEISVYEGVATVAGTSGRLQLKRGQRVRLEGGRLTAPIPFDPLAGDFRNGWLVTPGLTLAQLAERLNRTSQQPILITDRQLAGRKVAGRFRIDQPEALLANLGRLHGFTVAHDGGALNLRRA